MVDGFCAVDAEDWKRAGEVLTRAVSLQPSNPAPRLELSMALLHLGKVSEALAEADTIIATSDDACAVAPAWRRRGYILIEVADLKAAKAAYEKSLEIEPGNPIALQELRVIAEGLSNSKKKGTEGARGFVPPPPLGMKVTTCKRPGAGK
jgi:Tfp pilus assembly protein PilF